MKYSVQVSPYRSIYLPSPRLAQEIPPQEFTSCTVLRVFFLTKNSSIPKQENVKFNQEKVKSQQNTLTLVWKNSLTLIAIDHLFSFRLNSSNSIFHRSCFKGNLFFFNQNFFQLLILATEKKNHPVLRVPIISAIFLDFPHASRTQIKCIFQEILFYTLLVCVFSASIHDAGVSETTTRTVSITCIDSVLGEFATRIDKCNWRITCKVHFTFNIYRQIKCSLSF